MSKITSLSIGLLLNDILSGNAAIKKLGAKVFPPKVFEGEKMPWIAYRRADLQQVAVKAHNDIYDGVVIEIVVHAQKYAQCIAISEAVRSVMEDGPYRYTGDRGGVIEMGQTLFEGCDEDADIDAYIQTLRFSTKVMSK